MESDVLAYLPALNYKAKTAADQKRLFLLVSHTRE